MKFRLIIGALINQGVEEMCNQQSMMIKSEQPDQATNVFPAGPPYFNPTLQTRQMMDPTFVPEKMQATR